MRYLKRIAAALAVACVLAPATPALATTVIPFGTATATNVGAVTLVMPMVGTIVCEHVNTGGTVPGTPDNGNANGSVLIGLTLPVLTTCRNEIETVEVRALATFGTWSLTMMELPTGVVVGTMTVPSAGLQITEREFLRCVITASWSAYTPMTGRWANETANLTFTRQQTALNFNGTFCVTSVPTGNFTGALHIVGPGGVPLAIGP
jgi:hypothetical protein